jgi:hypothetical protein
MDHLKLSRRNLNSFVSRHSMDAGHDAPGKDRKAGERVTRFATAIGPILNNSPSFCIGSIS